MCAWCVLSKTHEFLHRVNGRGSTVKFIFLCMYWAPNECNESFIFLLSSLGIYNIESIFYMYRWISCQVSIFSRIACVFPLVDVLSLRYGSNNYQFYYADDNDALHVCDFLDAILAKDRSCKIMCRGRDLRPPWLLFVSERGHGKRVPLSSFRESSFNRVGLRGYKVNLYLSYHLFHLFLWIGVMHLFVEN